MTSRGYRTSGWRAWGAVRRLCISATSSASALRPNLGKGTTTMAITTDFSPGPGLSSVFRDDLNDTITASRDAARSLLINGDLFSGGTGKTRRKNGMENCNTRENKTVRRILVLASA